MCACEVARADPVADGVVCPLPEQRTSRQGLTERSTVENKFRHLPPIGMAVVRDQTGAKREGTAASYREHKVKVKAEFLCGALANTKFSGFSP